MSDKLPLRFGHIPGLFQIKSWGKDCPPPPPKSLFKNTMWNPFLGTQFFLTKYSTIFLEQQLYSTLSKNAFGFDPGPWEVLEPENTKIHISVYFMCFLVRSEIKSKSSIPIKCYKITVFKKNWSISSQKMALKKWISLCIFQKWFWLGGTVFLPTFLSEKSQTPRNMPRF